MNEDLTVEAVKPVPLKNLPDLKAIREALGLTIEDIFLKTRVNSAILNAIESGEFHLLPAPVSTNKFIRIYAETLGIDPEIILAHYQRFVDEKLAVPAEVNDGKARITFDRKPSPRYRWYAVLAVAIAVVACIVYLFVQKKGPRETVQQNVTVAGQKDVTPAPAPAPAPPVKEPLPEAVPAVPPASPPAAAAVPQESPRTPDNTHLNLLIEATEDTWLRIAEDRNPPYQITLKKGAKLSPKAREFYVIDVGNAAGVNITFLGTPLGTLGRKGQVVHLRLPRL